MTKDELIETLAAVEHARWADWQKYLHSRTELQPVTGPYSYRVIPHEWFERWERQINQPYAMLSEDEKQADRDEVARYWPVIVAFVAEWLAREADWEDWRRDEAMAQPSSLWREEMGELSAVTPPDG